MPEDTSPVLETRKLTKVFRDFWLREKVSAVSDLDLDVRPGEVYGLLGPNGSGKSTTLKMILGLLYPTSGRIAVFAKRPTDVATKQRIGFLPEESYLYPFLDAYETLEFYGRLFRQARVERKRRIEMLLDMVGLRAAGYRRVGEYSKGMQRRIGLAQALINDPDLLILDEPTSGMDPIGTRQFKELIRTLARRGKTVILSSHLLADVEDVCDRVCMLYGGRRRAVGAVDELLAKSDRTQLITDRLDETQIGQIRDLLEARGDDILEVSAPRERLEDLFLRVVEQAQHQRLATGGATAGGEVAAFLRAEKGEGREVIDRLVAGGQAEAEATAREQAPPEPPAPQGPQQDVIDRLVEPVEPTDASADRDEAVERRVDREVDRGVIDELLGGPEKARDESRRGDDDEPDGESGKGA